jgi:polynucleotide 5'-hydroxyl-kinase GRC3/NOL9
MMAKSRDRENRIRYRKKKFLDYFDEKRVSDFLIHKHDAMFLLNGKSFNFKDADFKAGTIIGLNHNDDTLALGVITEMTEDSIAFKSPLRSLRGINRVLLSEMTMS